MIILEQQQSSLVRPKAQKAQCVKSGTYVSIRIINIMKRSPRLQQTLFLRHYSLMLLVCLCCEKLIHLIRYKEVKTLIILIIQGLIIFHTRSIQMVQSYFLIIVIFSNVVMTILSYDPMQYERFSICSDIYDHAEETQRSQPEPVDTGRLSHPWIGTQKSH